MNIQAISRWTVLASWAIATHAFAQGALPADATPAAAPAPQAHKWLACDSMWKWFGSQCAGLKDAWYDGRPTLYLSGYTWHDPSTYTQEKLDEFNDKAWGGGFGWSKTAANGDHFGWYALVFRDSHFQYTKAAGWSWMTYWPAHDDFAVGLGYTAFLASRPDIANNWPFPAALPLAGIKIRKFELLGTFIPKLNAGINHGDVAYFFGRYQF
jgi:palmitoyl transferase